MRTTICFYVFQSPWRTCGRHLLFRGNLYLHDLEQTSTCSIHIFYYGKWLGPRCLSSNSSSKCNSEGSCQCIDKNKEMAVSTTRRRGLGWRMTLAVDSNIIKRRLPFVHGILSYSVLTPAQSILHLKVVPDQLASSILALYIYGGNFVM